MNAPTDSVTRRFNARLLVAARKERSHWLRTQKLVGGYWETIARWAPLSDPEEREMQWSSMNTHAEAFGGQVRLLRGPLLIAAWRDGELEVDEREVA